MNTIKIIKRLGSFVILLILLASTRKSQATPQTEIDTNCKPYISKAQTHINVKSDIITHWRQASLAEGIAHYDLEGNLSACVFSVSKADNDVGYLVISAQIDGNPVVEYSENPARYKLARTHTHTNITETDLQIDTSRPLYLGTLSYYYEILDDNEQPEATPDSNNTRTLLEMGKDNILSIDTQTIAQPLYSSKATSSKELPVSVDASEYVSDVPNNYNRNWSNNGCALGCGPSAAGAVVKFWADHGYPNLIPSGGELAMLWTLNGEEYLNTDCAGWSHLAGPENYPDVNFSTQVAKYAADRGYPGSFSGENIECLPNDQTCYDEFVTEINHQRPATFIFINWPNNNFAHVVVGVGYQDNELIVYDNIESSRQETYLTYGENYQYIVFNSYIAQSSTTPTPPTPTGHPTTPTTTPTISPTPTPNTYDNWMYFPFVIKH